LRIGCEQFQVVLLQDKTDDHGHFVGGEVYPQAFVHPAAKADEGKAVLAIFRQEVSFGLPLSAGVTIYVAASDLIPEVNKEPGVMMAVLVFVGAACMFLLDRFFHVH